MADEGQTAAVAQQTAAGAQSQGSAQAETVTMTRAELDERVRVEADRRATQAAETAHKKAAEKVAAEKAAAEKKALEAKGEYDKLVELQTKEHSAEVERLKQELVATRVNSALSSAALAGDAPIRDVSDLRLLSPDTVASCAKADGTVDAEKIKEAVALLREAKPYLFGGATGTTQPKGVATPGSGAPQTQQVLTPHDYDKIRTARLRAAKSLQAPSADQWASAAFLSTLAKTKP